MCHIEKARLQHHSQKDVRYAIVRLKYISNYCFLFFPSGSAPAKELDVWYAEQRSDLNSLRVYWKVGVKVSVQFFERD